MKYSIDTGSILNSWRKHYPPDIPVFAPVWHAINRLIDDRTLVASEEVYEEIRKQDDEIFKWASERKHMFIPIDTRTQLVLQEIMDSYGRLVDNRKNRSGADPWVIALAVVNRCTVITEEGETGKPEKPNIPDVCKALGIRYVNVVEMLREQSVVV